ncbi:MAG: hypothetical protein K0R15_701 [Clostridiales bacterium]|nr:hypothetical protein [Clostridiales bacterium]
MKKTQTSKLVYTALCVTLGILLPQIINLIPILMQPHVELFYHHLYFY